MSHFLVRPVALALCAAALLAGAASAEIRTVGGTELVLTATVSVAIDTDPALAGRMRLSADGSLGCLAVVSGYTVVIGTSGCGDEVESLRIAVPPGTAVTLTGSGDGTARVGDLHARLTATLADSYDLKAGSIGGLTLVERSSGDATIRAAEGPVTLEMTGSGDVRLEHVAGPLTVRRHGSGDLAVGGINAPAVDIDSAGSGDTLIGNGTIGVLAARMAGSGDMGVAARIATGDVRSAGGGDVRLGVVTGTLTRSAAGGSTIKVGGSAVVTEVMAKAASVFGHADGDEHGTTVRSSHVFVHLVMVLLFAVTVFLVWRMVRRSGGPGGLNRRGGPAAGALLHPGVAAVCDTMTRLEQRLGRLEGYVTTREFDLNRKFRDLG